MDNKLWSITIVHTKASILTVETIEWETFLFSTKEKAEEWLINNGFVFGKHDIFKDTEKGYWYHQRDTARNNVNVSLNEIEVDSGNAPDWIKGLKYRSKIDYCS